MNYGFVIDTRSCIGCHACSTACKSENEVPLGVHRTWVKYTETGQYPDTRRSFQVTRCNHCSNPPCVRICPVTAMYQRNDGIVEFDSSVCIGCKACMQACPYDAIYIDPDTKTAAKCHYCGHRVENGLEPACVVVCPTHSIIAGDMDDPQSEISRVLAKNDVTVRKPEQGTAPKLFYIQGHDVSLHPTALQREPRGQMFTDVLDAHGHATAPDYADATAYEVHLDLDHESGRGPLRVADSGVAIRPAREQGDPVGGPIQVAPGRMAGHMVSQVAYTAWHKVPWHWQVPAYLTTKAIGAGAFLYLAAGALAGLPLDAGMYVGGGLVGLIGLVLTTLFLVFDLEHPQRFLRIVTRPQWGSWLARGAFILMGFSTVAGLWWVAELASALQLVGPLGPVRQAFAAVSIPLGIGTAIYTAWLFAQCEGRDLWQSPLLPVHLFVQACVMGVSAMAWTAFAMGAPELTSLIRWTLFMMLTLDLAVILGGEFGIPHASELAAKAAHRIVKGKYSRAFWTGVIGVGHVLPMALLAATGFPLVAAAAGALALIGLYVYEHAFVMAPQELPNS